MSQAETRIDRDRQALVEAQDQGGSAVFKTYFRLSGPGWLQSAITLGSGSLAGALFLGVLGGTSLLWLQLVAIVMGVIMLSAIRLRDPLDRRATVSSDQSAHQSGPWLGLANRHLHGQHDLVHAPV